MPAVRLGSHLAIARRFHCLGLACVEHDAGAIRVPMMPVLGVIGGPQVPKELGAACARTLASLNFHTLGWSRSQKNIPGVECHSGENGLTKVVADTVEAIDC